MPTPNTSTNGVTKPLWLSLTLCFVLVTPSLGDSSLENDQAPCLKEWSVWKAEFAKTYETQEEESYRREIFCDAWTSIQDHNSGGHGWTMAVNAFSDMAGEEWRTNYNGFKVFKQPTSYGLNLGHLHTFYVDTTSSVDLPLSVDWVTQGHISPVKNQGKCGSCWSFSTTGAVEGHVSIKENKPPLSLSEQELVDCSSSYGDHGCDGGMMDFGFDYIQKNGGLCEESAYPYKAVQGKCRASSCTHHSPIKGHSDVQPGSEASLLAAVAHGPVSIAIEADQSSFQFYKSGVMTGHCGRALDHGVLVVGYGYDKDQEVDYWLVKNSWGATWGEEGYIRLLRNGTLNDGFGQCGILSTPSFPLV